MVKSSPVQSSFNQGEWSPHLWGRQDGVEAYESSCRKVENFDLLVQGPARFRSGFRYIRREPDTTFGARVSRFIRFEFSTTQAYIIEFCHLKVRFYSERGVVTEATKTITAVTKANPAVVTAVAHGYNNGDEVYLDDIGGMTELNNRFAKIANKTTDTFELVGIDSTSYTTYTSGGTSARIYELVSPYSESELPEIGYTQSADVLFLVHKNHEPQQLIRSSATSWAFSEFVLRDGPYLDQNTTTTTLTASGLTGSVTVTASSTTGINGNTGFQTADIGRHIRLIHGTGVDAIVGWGKITARASTTSVTVSVQSDFIATTATVDWLLGAFNDTYGWPSVVTFFQGRLALIEAAGAPQGVFLSYTNAYDYFAPTDYVGEVLPQSALAFYLDSNTVNKVFWAQPVGRSLVLGTQNGEWTIGANTGGEALTATTGVADESGTFGSSPVAAVKVGNNALFVGRTGRSIGRISFSYDDDGYTASSLNLLADHILYGGVVQLAYSGEPDNKLYVVMSDGRLLTMLYNTDQKVSGWSTVTTNGKVLSCAVIPSPDGGNNDLYITVEREIDGVKYKFTEVQDEEFGVSDSLEDAHFLDASAKYDGRSTPDTTLTVSAATGSVTITAGASAFGSVSVDDEIRIDDNIARITNVGSVTVVTATVLSDYEMPLTAKSGEWEILIRKDTIGGLWHLEGEEVTVIADGATHPVRTVENGSISLDDKFHTIHVGLSYTGRLVSRMFNSGARTGSAQGKIKRINRAVIQLFNTLGGFIGITNYAQTVSEFTEMQFRDTSDRMDRTPGLKSGFFQEPWPGGYLIDGSIAIEQRQALPMTVVSLAPDMTTYGDE